MSSSANPRLAFICAMPMEVQPLVRRLDLRVATIDGLDVHLGRVHDRDVVATVTGMGTVLATRQTERLVERVAVDRVLVVGITGALDHATPIGSIIVPEVVLDSATGAEHRPAPLQRHEPFGAMWTTDELLTDAEVLAGLRARGVISLDMETAAIAAVCERHGIEWSVIRSISDRANDGTVDEEIFGLSRQDGSPDLAAIARYVARRPTRIAHLATLGRNARRAANAAADAAIAIAAEPAID